MVSCLCLMSKEKGCWLCDTFTFLIRCTLRNCSGLDTAGSLHQPETLDQGVAGSWELLLLFPGHIWCAVDAVLWMLLRACAADFLETPSSCVFPAHLCLRLVSGFWRGPLSQAGSWVWGTASVLDLLLSSATARVFQISLQFPLLSWN